MEKEVIAQLKEKGLTIGSCESFTGGLFCARISAVPGASSVLRGGVVSYATDVKTDIVGVDKQIVKEYGVISEQCACDMARKIKAFLQVDVGVSFTGNAGPDRMEEKPAGTIYCAIAYQDRVQGYCLHLQKERNEVREEAVTWVMKKLIEMFR